MRKSFIIAAVLVAALTSCQKDLREISETGGVAVRATHEALTDDDATKASISDEGVFAWIGNEAVGIYGADGKWHQYNASAVDDSKATFVPADMQEHALSGYAVSPYFATSKPEIKDGALSVTLPSSYEWKGNQTNVAMLATFTDASKGLNFKHLGGLVKFTFKGVSACDGSLTFWATDSEGNNMKIAGEFGLEEDADGNDIIRTKTVTSEDKVTISYKAEDVTSCGGEMAFYVPVPVGSYVFNLTFKNGDFESTVTGSAPKTFERKTFRRIKAFNLGGVDGDSDDAVTTNVTVSKTLTSDDATTINLPATTVPVHVAFTADQDQDITLTYDALGEKPESVFIDARSFSGRLTVALPESHVELLSGIYTTIVAATGSNTLVVNRGVSVTTALTVTKGNAEFYGNMTATDATLTMDAEGSTLKVGVYDSAKNYGYISKLALTSCSSVEIAGYVNSIESGTTAADVLVKTSGVVVANSNSYLNVRVEKKSATVCGKFVDNNGTTVTNGSYTTFDIAGLQPLIDAAVKANEKTITLSESYSGGEYTIASGTELTINLGTNSVYGKFVVAKGASLTLSGSAGSLLKSADSDKAGLIIDNQGGTVALGKNVEYDGAVKNLSSLKGALTVEDGVLLEKVITAVDDKDVATSYEAYVNNAGTFATAAQNADITKITLTAAVTDVSQVTLKGTETEGAVTPKKLTIDLRGKGYTTDSNANAFAIENASVKIENSSYNSTYNTGAATINAGTGNVLALTGEAAAKATKEAYTKVVLGEGVALSGTNAISVDAENNSGVVVESNGADMSAAAISVSNGSANATQGCAPEFTITGGSVKNITASSYADWTLEGVTVDNSSDASSSAITLSAGVMQINGKTVEDAETTIIKGGSGANAVAVTGTGSLTVNGGTIGSTSCTSAISVSGTGSLEVKGGVIGDKTNAATGIAFTATGKTLSISGGTILGSTTGIAFSGKTLTLEGGVIGDATSTSTGLAVSAGTATISGEATKIEGSTDAIAVSGTGEVTLSDATLTGSADGIDISAGKLTVKSGSITGTTNALNVTSSPTVAINGGAFKGAIAGTVGIIKSGNTATFNDLSAIAYAAENAKVNITLPSGYSKEGVSDTYSVLTKTTVELDLNGGTVESSNTASTFKVAYGGTLTIKDSSEGKAGAVTNSGTNYLCIANAGTVTLEGGSYGLLENKGEMTINAGVSVTSEKSKDLILNGYAQASDYSSGSSVEFPTLTIKGGDFSATSNVTSIVKNRARGKLYIEDGLFVNEDSDNKVIHNNNYANISGGKFYSGAVGTYSAEGIVVYTESGQADGAAVADSNLQGLVEISGGYFQGKLEKTTSGVGLFARFVLSGGEYNREPDSDYLASGCKVTQSSGVLYPTYIVIAK